MKNLTVFLSLCLVLIVVLASTGDVWSQDCPLEPECILEPMEGRTIISLEESPFLCSPTTKTTCPAQSGIISVDPPIPSGTYDITLQSYDSHTTKPGQIQYHERYFLLLNEDVDTNAIDDLPYEDNCLTQTVNTDLFVMEDIYSIRAIHFCSVNDCDNGGANSIQPVCVAFDLVKEFVTDGRMTGGGSIAGTTTRHGFEIHCDLSEPNNVQVNWRGNKFHMESLDYAVCTEDDAIDQAPPNAAFDTFIGMGSGRLNGKRGATIYFEFVDAGEPGAGVDSATITIEDKNGNEVLGVSGLLKKGGNHQAH